MNNAKILIVEDETIVGLDIKNSLAKFGFYVTNTVTNYDDAIKSVILEEPNLIIMDINLENSKDGIETVQYIHKNINKIPIIYLTAFTDDLTINKAILTNPIGYLVKPFNREELKSMIMLVMYKIENKQKNILLTSGNFKSLGFDYFFNEDTSELFYKEQPIKLGSKERILLNILINSKGNIIPLNILEYEIWSDSFVANGAIRTLLYRLRSKLNHYFIETIPSIGIRFNYSQGNKI